MLNGILQGQHTSLALRLVSYIAVLLVHANHDSRHLWPANNGWENCSWSIITCKAGLAHSASVVHHKRGNFFVTHGCENKRVLKGVAKWYVQNCWSRSPKLQWNSYGTGHAISKGLTNRIALQVMDVIMMSWSELHPAYPHMPSCHWTASSGPSPNSAVPGTLHETWAQQKLPLWRKKSWEMLRMQYNFKMEMDGIRNGLAWRSDTCTGNRGFISRLQHACSILQRFCRQETRVQANAIQLSCCQSSPAASSFWSAQFGESP